MKAYTTSGRTPRKPPRKGSGPPPPPYLPMRYVRWEEYYDIWPNKEGSSFPFDNAEYPDPSPGWCSLRDEQFYDWLLAKNVEPEWFHQKSCRKVKQELLDEFSLQWLEEGDHPSPRRRLWIKNYGGHRDMFYNPNAVNRLFAYVKHIIGWLSNLAGEREYETLLVQRHPRVQVAHYFLELAFCDIVTGFSDSGEPILGGMIVVSRYDSNGEHFDMKGQFEVRKKSGIGKYTSYEWQPIADKPKRKTNGEQMDSIGDLFEEYEDVNRERGTDHTIG